MPKKYNLINNSLGWFCFLVAAVTYLLTLEPTASFWDCPEFISQGYKLEVGHPPGNPIFMLAARFFVNFAGGNVSHVALMVNAMSALLSAGTILLLFWTVTHLVRRLLVGRSTAELSLSQTIVVMGSGLCGALAYTWSDTFWFSAVEGEVYAFSSFCTALVFWLILKWDNRADSPHSDKYLILIAYVIGISIAVHLLNLLTIPAIGLVIYFRKAKKTSLKWTMAALLASFVVVGLILYGLVPGFVENAQYFELFFVNTLGMSYNIGVLFYAVLLVGVLIWCIRSLYKQQSLWQIRLSFILSVILSGIPFIGSSIVVPLIIIAGLTVYMIRAKHLSVRLLTIVATSILVIFIGYSSYALLLIRSHANPPMNQNAPDNVFALGSYLNREQYGETPLFYGPSFTSVQTMVVDPVELTLTANTKEGKADYTKVVETDSTQSDRYVKLDPTVEAILEPNMVFPRMYSRQPGHPEGYLQWIGESMESLPTKKINPYRTADGDVFYNPAYDLEQTVHVPTFGQNLRYFITYQLGHMYWRYFMWNFAGRQNDLQGNGEVNRGNWISGIPMIDNPRLGDQSLLPPDIGSENKGHNVFYMLPLLMGLLGIALQLVRGKEGIQQFWIVFLMFFMTGIAIVLYLNQPPLQPRERDYAFAGSFYAFAIWLGMGVAALWYILRWCAGKNSTHKPKVVKWCAVAAAVVGILVPLQMVSQTWDDHDRSGRYTTRDFGMNYLSSLDENAIIFTNGDNDTFPLWYAQEVEGYRTDVRVVNLAYLGTPWYVNQMRVPSYDAAGIAMQAEPSDYAYDRLQVAYLDPQQTYFSEPCYVDEMLEDVYKSPDAELEQGFRIVRMPFAFIPSNLDAAVSKGVITAEQAMNAAAMDSAYIPVDLRKQSYLTLSSLAALDMINTGIKNGWSRPAYFAMTVPEEYYLNMLDNLRGTGLAYQITPLGGGYNEYTGTLKVSTDKMYDNIMHKFRWGGLDQLGENGTIYLDETVRRMVTTHRSAMLDLASDLISEAFHADSGLYDDYSNYKELNPNEKAVERLEMAANIVDLMMEKLPVKHSPFMIQVGQRAAGSYCQLGELLGRQDLKDKGLKIYRDEIVRYAPYLDYFASLVNDERARRQRSSIVVEDVTLGNIALSRSDRYIPTYLYNMISEYAEYGGDDALDALQDELDRKHINIDNLTQFISFEQNSGTPSSDSL